MSCCLGRCCGTPQPGANQVHDKVAGSASLIVAVALFSLSVSFAVGAFSPTIPHHIASYIGAGTAVTAIIPMLVSSYLLCKTPS